jgi:hypothetical protein
MSLGLVVAGCGGSSGSGKSSVDQRASYIVAADRACASVAGEQNSLRQQAGGLTLLGLIPILRRQAGIADHLAAMLQALPHPAADTLPIDRYIAAVRGIGTYSAALANATAARHNAAILALRARLLAVKTAEHYLGQGYGYKVCTNGNSY